MLVQPQLPHEDAIRHDGGRSLTVALVDRRQAKSDLTLTVNEGRDAMRAGAIGLVRDLLDERVVSDDAWNDLKRALGHVKQEAANDCWKLDGPHLDGRFPKEPKRSGEVAVAR